MNVWKIATGVLIGTVGFCVYKMFKYEWALQDAKDALENADKVTKAAMDAVKSAMSTVDHLTKTVNANEQKDNVVDCQKQDIEEPEEK